MDGGNEQSVAIIFCFKAGLSATETLVLVQKADGNEALNRSRELPEDDERCGRPKSIRAEVNIAAVADLVKNVRRIASRISRVFEHPQNCISLDSERGFGKEKVVCTFCSTLLDN